MVGLKNSILNSFPVLLIYFWFLFMPSELGGQGVTNFSIQRLHGLLGPVCNLVVDAGIFRIITNTVIN